MPDEIADLRAELAALATRQADLHARLSALDAGAHGPTAAPGDPVRLGASNDGGTTATTITATTGTATGALTVVNPDPTGGGNAVVGRLGAGAGVGTADPNGVRRAGVVGESDSRTGVTGMSVDGAGVHGESASLIGVRGNSPGGDGVYGGGGDTGVSGYSETGVGVRATSQDGTAVAATSQHGPGVVARTDAANAVDAWAGTGYGVHAVGGKAPLRLKPSTKVGAPTAGSHLPGEFWVDQKSVLWFCTKAGTPGTCKKVTLT